MRSICKTSIGKTRIRNLTYAALLMLSMFSIQPSLAAAQQVKGSFTLTHEVYWKNRKLLAGDYTFSVQGSGAMQTLIVRNANDYRANTILLIDGVRQPRPNEVSELLLVRRQGQSFVSSMILPESDMVLEFTVPAATPVQISSNAAHGLPNR